MNAADPPAVLVAICADGDRIRPLVADRHDICLLDRGSRLRLLGGRVERTIIVGQAVIEVPLDGPLRAVEGAAQLLSRTAPETTVLALTAPDASPPPLESLRAVAASGLRAGVAVDRVRWVSAGWLWWTSRAGPSRLPVDLRSLPDRRRAATLLRSIADADDHDPVGQWLAAVAAGLRPAIDAEWPDIMAARYLQIGAQQLPIPRVVGAAGGV